MGLISRVSSRTYRYFLVRKKNQPFQLKMVQRITYKRRLCWNTSSNQKKIIKTPGGKLAFQYTGKQGTIAKCGDTGKKLQGVKAHRPKQLAAGRTQRRAKTVSRAYGGVISAEALKKRITRAFLIEEQKLVTKITKQSREAAAKAAKEEAAKASKKSKKSKGKK